MIDFQWDISCGDGVSNYLREGRLRAASPSLPAGAEGAMALPGHEFGLDVIVLVGRLRHREHRSVPEIHKRLREQGVAIAERSVTNLLDRYDELLAMTNCWRRRWATALGCGNGWRPRGG
jgi:hypothetical protein